MTLLCVTMVVYCRSFSARVRVRAEAVWRPRRMFTGTNRSVPLHTFKPESGRQWTYSSTKIGGHPFDHPGGLGEMTDLWSAPPRRRFGGLPASFWVALEEAQCSEAAPNTAHNPQSSSTIPQGPGCRDNHAHRGPEAMASFTPWMGLEEFTVYRRYFDSLCRQRRLPPPVFSAPQHQQGPTGAGLGGHDLTFQPAVHVLGAGAAYPQHHHEGMQRTSRRWKRPRGGFGPMAVVATAASVYKYLRKTGVHSLATGGTLSVGTDRFEDGDEMLLEKLVAPLSDVEAWSARVASAPRWSQLRRYTFVRSLGKGAHAETFLVERHGARYVLKESSALPEAVNEARLLSQVVGCANVVRLEDFFIELLGGMRHVAYLQLEYCDGGDLASLITRGSEYRVLALDDHTICSIVVQVANGLKAMHAKHIIHRDLKPENILLTTEGMVKIADLGVSTRMTASLPTTTTAAGSVPFMAPEVRRFLLGEDVSYTEKADIWALGAVTYAMCCSIPVPNLAKMPPELAVAEVMAHRGWPPTTPRSAVSERLCRLMLHTLLPSSESRPSAEGCRAMLLTDEGLEDDTRPLQAILSKL